MVKTRSRVDGSLRDIGQVTIAVDKETKKRLKAIAGSMPINRFLRDWTKRVYQGKELSFTCESYENALPATKGDLEAILLRIDSLESILRNREFLLSSLPADVRSAIDAAEMGEMVAPEEFTCLEEEESTKG